jgi:lycopene cyclase domain-containing protein
MHSAYLLIDLVVLAIPLIYSLGKQPYFLWSWKPVALGIGFASTLFLCWDIIFTRIGVWHFRTEYTLGARILNIPMEEVLYFLAIPFANLFIYERIRNYYPRDKKQTLGKWIGWILVVGCGLLFVLHYNSLYTSVTALLLLISIVNHLWITRGNYINYLLLTWLFSLAPMVLIYIITTGLPIQQFNEKQIVGWRIGSIPVELLLYHMLYLFWMIPVYEKYKQKGLEKAEARKAKKAG